MTFFSFHSQFPNAITFDDCCLGKERLPSALLQWWVTMVEVDSALEEAECCMVVTTADLLGAGHLLGWSPTVKSILVAALGSRDVEEVAAIIGGAMGEAPSFGVDMWRAMVDAISRGMPTWVPCEVQEWMRQSQAASEAQERKERQRELKAAKKAERRAVPGGAEGGRPSAKKRKPKKKAGEPDGSSSSGEEGGHQRGEPPVEVLEVPTAAQQPEAPHIVGNLETGQATETSTGEVQLGTSEIEEIVGKVSIPVDTPEPLYKKLVAEAMRDREAERGKQQAGNAEKQKERASAK